MPSTIAVQYADRSTAIIVLGIFSVLLLGPLAGIPAWIMARHDLRDLRAGFIAPSAASPLTIGKWLAIVGTFFSPVWLFVYAVILFVVVIVAVSLGAVGSGIMFCLS